MYLLRAEFEVFRESRMDTLQLIGGVLLMTGVAIGLWKRRRRTPVEVAA
jgi:LPXTG-motif cell wall-anchored protein